MQLQAGLTRASSLQQERYDEQDSCATHDQEWFGHPVPLSV